MSEYKRLTSYMQVGDKIVAIQPQRKERIQAYIDRLFELEDKLESGLLKELPCRVGDTVYGVDFTECQSKYATTEREKRKIFNECVTRSGDCDKCKYGIPAVHKFVCRQIQIAEEKYTFVVGAKCENYRFENVFVTQEEAEARLKELQEGKK